jgi:hypothetical protein
MLTASLMALSADASAQPSKAASSEPIPAEARQRFGEGVQLADAGDHEGARLKFNQAWALLKSPAVLFNLARSEQLSGHLVDALGHYRLFMTMASDPKVTDAQRRRATDNIAELSKKVGQIELDTHARARVSIDGSPVTASISEPILVTAGSHLVEAVLDAKVRNITLDCPPGTITKASLSFDDPKPHPPPDEAPKPAPRQPDAASSTVLTTRNVLGASLGLASLVGVGVFVGFLVDANGKSSDAASFDSSFPGGACAQRGSLACTELGVKNDNAQSSRTVSYVGLGASVLFAAGAALTFVLWPSAPTRKDARLLRARPIIGNMLGLMADF